MAEDGGPLSDWTPEQIALGKRWVETWRRAGEALERIRRQELKTLDQYHAISLLCGPGTPPLRPSSGLIEQQRWFRKVARHS